MTLLLIFSKLILLLMKNVRLAAPEITIQALPSLPLFTAKIQMNNWKCTQQGSKLLWTEAHYSQSDWWRGYSEQWTGKGFPELILPSIHQIMLNLNAHVVQVNGSFYIVLLFCFFP